MRDRRRNHHVNSVRRPPFHRPAAKNSSHARHATRGVTKIFISNFPDHWSTEEVFGWLRRFGRITDIYIAKGRTKVGRRYGFVSFTGVQDHIRLVSSIDSAWIGMYKMRTNIAKFPMEGPKHVIKPSSTFTQFVSNIYSKERSFAEVTRDSKKAVNSNSKRSSTHESWIELTPTEEDLEWAGKCLVGICKESVSMEEVSEGFNQGGFKGIYLIPFDSNSILIQADKDKIIQKVLEEDKSWLDQLFIAIRHWNEEDTVRNRMVWVSVIGMPLHVWNQKSFEMVVSNRERLLNLINKLLRKQE